MRKLVLLIALLFVSPVFGQEPIKKVTMPVEIKDELKVSLNDPSIEGKQWNRWTSKNFTVVCLNNQQAQYLHQHLELVKSWAFARWGLYDTDFSAECRLICVDDPALFRKLFNIDRTKVEIRRDGNGKIQLSVIFALLNQSPSKVIPVPISEVCMSEFEQRYNSKFPWWAVRGMSLLNGSLDQIKLNIRAIKGDLESNKPMFFSKALMETDKTKWESMPDDRRSLYDRSSIVFLLMLRKEFGQNKTHWMINKTVDGKDPEKALNSELGFGSYNEFDETFKRYMRDLSKEVSEDKTPDSYLQIKPPNED